MSGLVEVQGIKYCFVHGGICTEGTDYHGGLYSLGCEYAENENPAPCQTIPLYVKSEDQP